MSGKIMYQIRDTETNRVLETGRESKTVKDAVDALYEFLESEDFECPRNDFNMDDVEFFGYKIECGNERKRGIKCYIES